MGLASMVAAVLGFGEKRNRARWGREEGKLRGRWGALDPFEALGSDGDGYGELAGPIYKPTVAVWWRRDISHPSTGIFSPHVLEFVGAQEVSRDISVSARTPARSVSREVTSMVPVEFRKGLASAVPLAERGNRGRGRRWSDGTARTASVLGRLSQLRHRGWWDWAASRARESH